jgi:hypothetical protein
MIMDTDRDQLFRTLTALAAGVVKSGHTELALAWLWSCKAGEPLPGVSRDLLRVLQFVSDNRYTEVEEGYRGSDYFEDCMQLAMRKSWLAEYRGRRALRSSAAGISPT